MAYTGIGKLTKERPRPPEQQAIVKPEPLVQIRVCLRRLNSEDLTEYKKLKPTLGRLFLFLKRFAFENDSFKIVCHGTGYRH